MYYTFMDIYIWSTKFYAQVYLLMKEMAVMGYMIHSLNYYFYTLLEARFRQEGFTMLTFKKK